jgi:hypothetical protein
MSTKTADDMKLRMDSREELLRQIFGDDIFENAKLPMNTHPLFPLKDMWPDVIDRLRNLLTEAGELELAATVDGLWVFDRCRCGAEYCATIYTKPRPSSGYGPNHRNVVFWNPNTVDLDAGKTVGEMCTYPTTQYTTILDVVNNEIACIEILGDHDSRSRLLAALPDPAALTAN